MKTLIATALVSLFALASHANVSPLTTVQLNDGRSILADANGLSVYTFDIDDPGVSNCYNGCAKAWPPVLVESASGLEAPLGVTTRKDGTLQLTVNNQPIYLFVGDKQAGDITGDGLDEVWHLIVL